MHFSILRRHGKAIGAQKRVVARYWRRMYGSRWGEYEARRIADLAESISGQLATEPGQCRPHADRRGAVLQCPNQIIGIESGVIGQAVKYARWAFD